MRHFDAWILRDPYSIFHYYSTGHRWKETVRDLIQQRKICAPPALALSLDNGNTLSSPAPVDPYARPLNPQSSSPFLTKLPLEIRLMVYEYAFGDQVVHLVQLKDKIRHVRCENTISSLDKNRRCCPTTPARWREQENATASTTTTIKTTTSTSMLYPHTHPSLPSSLSDSSASLLRTCRTIYAEAAQILYTNSTFDVDDLTTFIAFTLSISPQRLRSIKRLAIQWTPVWQPLAGEEHKSSIYSHTHNDKLWALFWTRVGALSGLEDLTLSIDLGRFAGTPPPPPPTAAAAPAPNVAAGGAGSLVGGHRLRLSISEPWAAPLLTLRGLRSFELGITARCDAAAKQALEGDLVRDAVRFRDHLRMVLCSEPGAPLPALPGVKEDLQAQVDLLRRCAFEERDEVETVSGARARPRLAIMAA
ncbi:hypothetical protein BJY01DRAFT_230188 [Aspergillus pseudoustus]|uniref:DUF7730 domain-containing protein n=1 Tax=Aspergillus pseudoustus TaxID=1810923 RepID=A0ABR4ICB5_9EURO